MRRKFSSSEKNCAKHCSSRGLLIKTNRQLTETRVPSPPHSDAFFLLLGLTEIMQPEHARLQTEVRFCFLWYELTTLHQDWFPILQSSRTVEGIIFKNYLFSLGKMMPKVCRVRETKKTRGVCPSPECCPHEK